MFAGLWGGACNGDGAGFAGLWGGSGVVASIIFALLLCYVGVILGAAIERTNAAPARGVPSVDACAASRVRVRSDHRLRARVAPYRRSPRGLPYP